MPRHLAFLSALAVVGCAHAPVQPRDEPEAKPAAAPAPEPVPQIPGLLVRVSPPDSELTIDGRPYGDVSKLSNPMGVVPLKPGIYQVSLKRKGFQTWRAEVTVNERAELIKVELVAH